MLSDAETTTLEFVLERIQISKEWEKLTEYEQGFIISQRDRYDRYGRDMWVSPKQWAIIMRIEKALGGSDD